ncbi:UV excision repair protein RAD23 [Carpediemonas membranifera]|uniref:UV excision repair protein RAD23 n=1 Tax=Carpediemonas membranifera TaxID=201153 RepID=A0A8J6E4I9_9EUKA|nr:UV excision repair protein RAD23 [Carpediemonas membranifera]|eukprot:KAG9397001.1 UV excision repair protein RAD23 [Carpediemonas membranifera]
MKIVVAHPDQNKAEVFELDDVEDNINIETLRELVTQRFRENDVLEAANITDFHMMYGGCILFGNKTLKSFGFSDGDRITTSPRFYPTSPPPRTPARAEAPPSMAPVQRTPAPLRADPQSPEHAPASTARMEGAAPIRRLVPASSIRRPMAYGPNAHPITPIDPAHAEEYIEWLGHQRALFNQAAFDYMRSVRATRRPGGLQANGMQYRPMSLFTAESRHQNPEDRARRTEAAIANSAHLPPHQVPLERGGADVVARPPRRPHADRHTQHTRHVEQTHTRSRGRPTTQIRIRLTQRPLAVETALASRWMRHTLMMRLPMRLVFLLIVFSSFLLTHPLAVLGMFIGFIVYMALFSVHVVDREGSYTLASLAWDMVPFRVSQTSILGSLFMSLFPGWSFVANAASIVDNQAREAEEDSSSSDESRYDGVGEGVGDDAADDLVAERSSDEEANAA